MLAEKDLRKENSSDRKKLFANRYKLESKLTKNENGKTFLVSDTKNNDEQKVMKIVDINMVNKSQIKELLREENIISKLNHPYIVKYYESFMDGDNLCVITEFCEGGSLHAYLKEKKKSNQRLSEDRILYFFSQLLSAAYYLHSLQVLHRNLKPANIYIKNGIIKVGDFGISRMVSYLEDAKSFIGTPYYMSPEVVKNEPYNSKADIWAIGCILYELCTFQHPFIGDKVLEVFDAIVKEEPPSIINLYSNELNKIIKITLKKSPFERPSAADLLNEPIILAHIKVKESQYKRVDNR